MGEMDFEGRENKMSFFNWLNLFINNGGYSSFCVGMENLRRTID